MSDMYKAISSVVSKKVDNVCLGCKTPLRNFRIENLYSNPLEQKEIFAAAAAPSQHLLRAAQGSTNSPPGQAALISQRV